MLTKKIVLVLDAMGVIYESADDVAELLVPFVAENGGESNPALVGREYREASLGRISASAFWSRLRVSPVREDEYLSRHRLAHDFPAFLRDLPEAIQSLWCLSNDVSEWSIKLRIMHGLQEQFSGFVISGDVGVRKPSPGIYKCLLAQVDCEASNCILVDDRVTNLDAAAELGFQTVLFARGEMRGPASPHRTVASFSDLARHLAAL